MSVTYRPTRIRLQARRVERRSGIGPRGLVLAVAFGLLALAFDRACDAFKRGGHKRQEALSDGAAHIATALAVSLPAAPYVRDQKRFVFLAALAAVAIEDRKSTRLNSSHLVRSYAVFCLNNTT